MSQDPQLQLLPETKTRFELLERWKQRVVDLIIQGETPTAAVRQVKPGSKRPDLIASKLRKDTRFMEALSLRRSEAIEESGIETAQILIDIAQLARVNPKALVWLPGEDLPKGARVGQPKKLHELDDATARCIQSIRQSKKGDLEVKFVDRLAAKKLLGQYKRLFTETHEINLGEKTLEQLVQESWNRQRPASSSESPAAIADSHAEVLAGGDQALEK